MGNAAAARLLREDGPLAATDAHAYIEMMGIVHMLASLDVWRRNSQEFLSGDVSSGSDVATSPIGWVVQTLDSVRYANADACLEELASYARVMQPITSAWPESDERYAAVMTLVGVLATTDEAWTKTSSKDDDGTNLTRGTRHVVVKPVKEHDGSAMDDDIRSLPDRMSVWTSKIAALMSSGKLQQRKGR